MTPFSIVPNSGMSNSDNSDQDSNLDEGSVPSIVITKEQLENIINSDITDDDWNTFAYNAGCCPRYLDSVRNAITVELIDTFGNTGIWPSHTLGSLFDCCFPSFDELKTFLLIYNITLTDEIWNEYYHNSNESDVED
jgi:hypothetical protein